MLYLASRSPRRRQLLTEHGLAHAVIDSGIDDGQMPMGGVGPVAWAGSLAYLKARAAFDDFVRTPLNEPGLILGADTLCVVDGRVIGKPADGAEAEAMIRGLMNRAHDVITGVCLLCPITRDRDVFAVRSTVTLGSLDEATVAAYIESGEWRDKAGGYNYFDRLAAGWPLRCEGDPTAVVGLPMEELRRRLSRYCDDLGDADGRGEIGGSTSGGVQVS